MKKKLSLIFILAGMCFLGSVKMSAMWYERPWKAIFFDHGVFPPSSNLKDIDLKDLSNLQAEWIRQLKFYINSNKKEKELRRIDQLSYLELKKQKDEVNINRVMKDLKLNEKQKAEVDKLKSLLLEAYESRKEELKEELEKQKKKKEFEESLEGKIKFVFTNFPTPEQIKKLAPKDLLRMQVQWIESFKYHIEKPLPGMIKRSWAIKSAEEERIKKMMNYLLTEEQKEKVKKELMPKFYEAFEKY